MATSEDSRDDGEADVTSSSMSEIQFFGMIVASYVADMLQANSPFTPEDIERIKDHVSPNGVAFWNGYRHAMDHVKRLEKLGYVSSEAIAALQDILNRGTAKKP